MPSATTAAECVFCGVQLRGGGEEHHFPVPQRNGGTDTVTTCRGCHDKADRYRLDSWGGSEMFGAMFGLWEKADASERVLLAKMIAVLDDARAVLRGSA